MTLLRQEETMHILNNYQNFTHQELLDHFFKNNNDSDCIYIFDNLPQDLQKKLDELAGEISKQNVVLLKNLDELLEASSKRNKKLDDDIYQIENELERVRELNRQLGI
jgi:beta-glucosidase-like glycosyl hydrolase